MRSISVCLAALLVLAACGDSDPSPGGSVPSGPAGVATTVPDRSGVEIAAVHERVEYYGACGNELVTVAGVTYYPILREDLEDLDVDRYPLIGALVGLVGFVGSPSAPRVAPPGPGDDIGDMIVYVDGIARFESDSGWVIWLTDQEQTYSWEC